MAEHAQVEYETADGNDYAAHEGTYEGFLHLAVVGSLYVINTVLGLAIIALTSHSWIAMAVLVISVIIAAHGLWTGSRMPSVVMVVLSLLAFGLSAAG